MDDLYPSRTGTEDWLLPRRDPLIYSTWHEGAPVTRAAADAFARDGYLICSDLFPEADVAALQEAARTLLQNPEDVAPETVIFEPGTRDVRSIFAIHRQVPVLARLARDPRLADIARFLLGDDVYLTQSRLNYKPGFVGKEFYWHSDFETWHVEDGMPRMRALSMSVLLAENTHANGPLMVIPGSHRIFVSCVGETPDNHYRTSLRKQEYGVPGPESLTRLAEGSEIVAATGKPGTVIVFDCNLMHGSNGNITPFPRSNAFFVYNAVGNRLVAPFGGTAPRPDFIAARGAPDAIGRTAGAAA